MLVTMVGSQGTNAVGFLTTAEDWTIYGRIQQSLSTDRAARSLS